MSQVKPLSNTSLQNVFSEEPQADVLSRRVFGSRIFILNRPEKLNALNLSMARNMTPQLQAWNESDLCKVITIKGAGNKAFCAGGDVTSVVQRAEEEKANPNHEGTKAVQFFEAEYQLDHLIATLNKPFVALLDGITMGGGVGLSIHAPFRIATENTVFAMPEAGIGLFPDVGGSFFLPRMDGETGTYLALTGARLRGMDVFLSGIATHYVPSTRLLHLEDRLSELETDDHEVVNAAIEDFVERPESDCRYVLGGDVGNSIDRCFRYDTVEEIITALQDENSEWASSTVKHLETMSPTSLKVTLRELREGKKMKITECFQLEYRLVQKFLEKSDFSEGVKARLIHKTNNPRWNPSSLRDVQDDFINEFYFHSPVPKQLSFLNNVSFGEYPHVRFALPPEEEVRKVVTGEMPDAGSMSMTADEVVDFFLKERKGKIGVREKVMDVLSRKTKPLDGNHALKWVGD